MQNYNTGCMGNSINNRNFVNQGNFNEQGFDNAQGFVTTGTNNSQLMGGQINNYENHDVVAGQDYAIQNQNYYDNYHHRYNNYYVTDYNYMKDHYMDYNLYHHDTQNAYAGEEYHGAQNIFVDENGNFNDMGQFVTTQGQGFVPQTFTNVQNSSPTVRRINNPNKCRFSNFDNSNRCNKNKCCNKCDCDKCCHKCDCNRCCDKCCHKCDCDRHCNKCCR